jgi:PPM family protein phosphatase
MSACPTLEVACLSDPGLKRSHNEDHAASDPRLGLVVMADGMGGYRSGEVASALAVQTIVRHVRLFQHQETGHIPPESTGLSPASRVLLDAIGSANTVVFQTGRREADCEGMATTVIAAWFIGDRIAVGHVGDSRLYRVRGASIEQITTDHSLVQELIEQGVYTPEEAQKSAPKNLVTRAIGIHATVDVDVYEEAVLPEDVFLLCTDGLHDLVSNQEMYLTLREYSANLVAAAGRLVAMAKERGGHDNISVMLARPRARRRLRWGGRLRRWLG